MRLKKGGVVMFDTKEFFQKAYEYEQLNNDIGHAFRLPKKLKDDFDKVAPDLSKTLRMLMVQYIVEHSKDNK